MGGRIACSLDQIKTITPAEAGDILDSDTEGKVVLLDVRQPEEYEADHIPGAKLIPLGELEDRHGELDKEGRVVTYCRSGKRSLGAAVLLCGLGFQEVYNIGGGILYWGRELVSGPVQEGMELLGGVVEAKDALLLAFRLEYGSWDFYSRVGGRLLGKSQAIPMLVDMENEHMDSVYTKLVKHWDGNPPTLEELKQQSGDYTEAGISVNEALLRFGEDTRDDLEVIESALEMECKAYDLYKRMRNAVDNDEVKGMFQELAMAESHHIQELSGELKRFTQSG